MKINQLIKQENIIFTDKTDKKSILNLLIHTANDLDYIADKEIFLQAIYEREKIVGTGIGLGVAIPHAKIKEVKNFFIVIGILNKGVNWDAIDNKPVRIVFLIGGPENAHKKYLHILSQVVKFIKDKDRREKIFSAASKEMILNLFNLEYS